MVGIRRGSVPECKMQTHSVLFLVLLVLALLTGLPAGEADVGRRDVQEVVYCVAKPDADSSKLQEALDWVCGGGNSLGSVDCSAIQTGGSCFQPDTLADHASYAFTLYYYHQNAASHACDFQGLATLTSTNPSSGTCVYPTSQTSASSSSPSDGSSGLTPTGSSPLLPILGSPAPSPNGASSCFSFSFSLPCALLKYVLLVMPLAFLLV